MLHKSTVLGMTNLGKKLWALNAQNTDNGKVPNKQMIKT